MYTRLRCPWVHLLWMIRFLSLKCWHYNALLKATKKKNCKNILYILPWKIEALRHVQCLKTWTGAWPASKELKRNFNRFEMYLWKFSGNIWPHKSSTAIIAKFSSTSGICFLIYPLCTHERASTLSLTICCLLPLDSLLNKRRLSSIQVSVLWHGTCWMKNMSWAGTNDWVISPCRLLGSRDPSGLMFQKSNASPIFGLTDIPFFANSLKRKSDDLLFAFAKGNTVSPPSSTSELEK